MDVEQLKSLLGKPEGPTLEFKSEAYQLDHPDNNVQNRQRDELIKDVLALANGNSITAGDPAFLILGAADDLDEFGNRPITGADAVNLDRVRILKIVNAACEPAIEEIGCEPVEVDGKILTVITVIATPHLHETTREITPQSGKFNKYVAFVRHNESVDIASAQERDAILKLKRLRFDERRNPPATPFGAAIGGVIGGYVAYAMSKQVAKNDSAALGAAIGGTLIGSMAGGSLGSTYNQLADMRQEWPRMSARMRWATVLMIPGVYIGLLSVYSLFSKRIRRGKATHAE